MNSCKRRLLKLFRGLFLFQDRLTYALVGGRSQYHGNGVAPQRQIGFFADCGCGWPAGVARVAIGNGSAEWDRVPIGNRARRGVLF